MQGAPFQVANHVTPSGMAITFFQHHGAISAQVNNGDSYSDEHIHVNVNNSPEMTTPFRNHQLAWQLAVLGRIQDVSMAFNGELLITQLTDWGGDLNTHTLHK